MLFLFEFFRLPEKFSNTSDSNTVFHSLLDDSLASPFINFSLLILVTLHSICFAGASLPISEYGSMKPIHDLPNKPLYLQLLKDLCLTVLLVYYFVKSEGLFLHLCLVTIWGL